MFVDAKKLLEFSIISLTCRNNVLQIRQMATWLKCCCFVSLFPLVFLITVIHALIIQKKIPKKKLVCLAHSFHVILDETKYQLIGQIATKH